MPQKHDIGYQKRLQRTKAAANPDMDKFNPRAARPALNPKQILADLRHIKENNR